MGFGEETEDKVGEGLERKTEEEAGSAVEQKGSIDVEAPSGLEEETEE